MLPRVLTLQMDYHKCLRTPKVSSQDGFYARKLRTNLFGIYCANEDIIHCLFYDESIGGTGLNEVACVAAVSFPFPNAREREENCERMANFFAHPRRAPSLARFSFAFSIFAPPEKLGKESAATQAMDHRINFHNWSDQFCPRSVWWVI